MLPENIKKRGISEAIFNAFKLSYKDGKLDIPIFDINGKKLFSKYRHDTGKVKYTYDVGGTAQLYGAHLIKNKDTVVLTEGELDTLVLWSNKIVAVSATSGCSSNYKNEWVELLKDKKLYICYDSDEPGLKGSAKLKKTFPKATVLFLKDVNDISDYFEKHGEVQSIFKLTEGELPEVIDDVYVPKTIEQQNESDDRIQKAKQVPITNFQNFNREKKIPCIFHNEKTASLAYKPSNNTFKCFGCGRFGDSIGFYMQLKNVDFPTALYDLVGPKPTPTILPKTKVPINVIKTKTDTKTESKIPQEIEASKIEFYITNSVKNPQVRKIGPNIKLIFDNHPEFKGKFRYDSFNGVFETSFLNNKWEELEDHILRIVISKVQKLYPFFDSGVEKIIKDYTIIAAMENSVSPPLQYIESLTWDKTPRLATWLHKTYHVTDNEYYREIGTRWMKYLVKRLKYPGAKFDHVLIMNGVQGFGKSMILEKLCKLNEHNYFNETTQTPDQGKDFMIELRGNIIVEFAEGSITGYKDQKKVKSFITKQTDKYRPPYMKNSKNFPRQNVFAMTINDKSFLKDNTGERRYWPMEIPQKAGLYGDFKWIEENRDQLFAEAYTLINEPYTQFSEEVQKYLNDLIDEYKELDPVEDIITEWFDSLTTDIKKKGVSIKDGKDQISDDTMREFKTKYLDKEIAAIYLNVLHLKQVRKTIGGVKKRVYVPTDNTPMEDGEVDQTSESLQETFDKF